MLVTHVLCYSQCFMLARLGGDDEVDQLRDGALVYICTVTQLLNGSDTSTVNPTVKIM